MNKFLKETKGSKDYKPLDQLVELFDGEKDCLVHVCVLLFNSGPHKMCAKGIYDKYKLTEQDFITTFEYFTGNIKNHSYVAKQIEQMNYDGKQDFQATKDYFDPVSKPSDDYLRLPQDVQVEFIDKENKIDLLKSLIGQQYIGVDAEWRVNLHKWHQAQGVAVLQIAGA